MTLEELEKDYLDEDKENYFNGQRSINKNGYGSF
jgi:hypothetical protein